MGDEEETWTPSRWRVLLAFATVPGLAAIALATVEPFYAGLDSYFERVWRTALVVAIVAYPLGVVFGLPAYLFLRDRVTPTWLNCSLAGAFVAAAPWTSIVFLSPSADQASRGGRATVVNGTTTAYGHLVALQFVGIIALWGALAGLLFWTIAAARLKAHSRGGNRRSAGGQLTAAERDDRKLPAASRNRRLPPLVASRVLEEVEASATIEHQPQVAPHSCQFE